MFSFSKALAALMNNYFFSITVNLDLKRDSENFYDRPTSVYSIKNQISRSRKYFEN